MSDVYEPPEPTELERVRESTAVRVARETLAACRRLLREGKTKP